MARSREKFLACVPVLRPYGVMRCWSYTQLLDAIKKQWDGTDIPSHNIVKNAY